jgi:hypothetical protein
MITNTLSVGVVRDAAVEWMVKHDYAGPFWYPVVAETADVRLNDMKGQHVKKEHALQALDSARGGQIQEGNVGGGTGMSCNGFKGGTGTSSRKLSPDLGGYTVGVLLQCNYGVDRSYELPASRSDGRSRVTNLASRGPLIRRCEWATDNLLPFVRSRSATKSLFGRDGARIHHSRREYGCTTDGRPAQAHGETGKPRLGADRLYRGQRLGRHFHCVLNGQSRIRWRQQHSS